MPPARSPALHRALGRAVVAVEDELRKRLGSTFSVKELATLYREDSDWGLELTIDALPGRSELWDSSTVVDAAFYLYMREAADFAGGTAAPDQAGVRLAGVLVFVRALVDCAGS